MKKLIPKYQKGRKTPSTFIGGAVGASGGDSDTADIISSLAGFIPPIGLGLGLLDLGYDINGITHDEKTWRDAGFDILALLPFVKGVKGINLLKKSDRFAYLKSQIGRKYGKYINSGIWGGKGVDALDDSVK